MTEDTTYIEMVQDLAQDPLFLAEHFLELTKDDLNLFHGALGIATEAGELLDPLKKAVTYGKPLDKVNIIEELGDIYFYLQLCCLAVGLPMSEIRRANLKKLRSRYSTGKWTYAEALERNTEAERNEVAASLEKQ